MTAWTSNELDRIGRAEELEIASLRPDATLRRKVTIWVVRVGDELFVRSAYGRSASWFRGTQVRHEGRIESGGIATEVMFEDADPVLNDRIDAEYRSKYREHSAQYVEPMVAADARSTTIRLVPR